MLCFFDGEVAQLIVVCRQRASLGMHDFREPTARAPSSWLLGRRKMLSIFIYLLRNV